MERRRSWLLLPVTSDGGLGGISSDIQSRANASLYLFSILLCEREIQNMTTVDRMYGENIDQDLDDRLQHFAKSLSGARCETKEKFA